MTNIRLKDVLRAGLQSGAIMSVADVTTQIVIEGKTFERDYSLTRTLRWTIAGQILHGPYFYVGFLQLDKFFAARQQATKAASAITWKMVAQKTAAAQFVLFPPYLALLFGYMGYMEGHPNIVQKIQQRVPEAFMSGCIYWPVANGINFAIIPSAFRIPYLALSAGIWNSYLSWINHRNVAGGNKIDVNERNEEKNTTSTT